MPLEMVGLYIAFAKWQPSRQHSDREGLHAGSSCAQEASNSGLTCRLLLSSFPFQLLLQILHVSI